jgi:glycosyltransferase involved in cell wall biosynthesis
MTNNPKNLKIAVINDFFFQNGGAEKVVEEILELFPAADIYSTIFVESKFRENKNLTKAWQENRIHTTWLQGFFTFKDGYFLRFFKHFFWLYPIVMRGVKVANYDLVIISSTDCAKQVKIIKKQTHLIKGVKVEDFGGITKILHYCHTPTRYLHGLITETDHSNLGAFQRFILKFLVPMIRKMDLEAAERLNKQGCIWIANSVYIQGLIRDIYKVDSTVVFPPIDLDRFLPIEPASLNKWNKDPYLLCHGRISFHKRIDLAIQACLELGINLKISGTSAVNGQMQQLKNLAKNYKLKNPSCESKVEFLGRTSDEQVMELITNCGGFLFPGKEDFGIAPVEMLVSGIPLIAYGSGGALEYVQDGVNGVFFGEQTVESTKNAILRFKQMSFDKDKIKETSQKFSTQKFRDGIMKLTNN